MRGSSPPRRLRRQLPRAPRAPALPHLEPLGAVQLLDEPRRRRAARGVVGTEDEHPLLGGQPAAPSRSRAAAPERGRTRSGDHRSRSAGKPTPDVQSGRRSDAATRTAELGTHEVARPLLRRSSRCSIAAALSAGWKPAHRPSGACGKCRARRPSQASSASSPRDTTSTLEPGGVIDLQSRCDRVLRFRGRPPRARSPTPGRGRRPCAAVQPARFEDLLEPLGDAFRRMGGGSLLVARVHEALPLRAVRQQVRDSVRQLLGRVRDQDVLARGGARCPRLRSWS